MLKCGSIVVLKSLHFRTFIVHFSKTLKSPEYKVIQLSNMFIKQLHQSNHIQEYLEVGENEASDTIRLRLDKKKSQIRRIETFFIFFKKCVKRPK